MTGAEHGAERIEVVFDAGTLQRRVAELAEEIAAADLDDLLVVPVLTGSFIFAADLLRALHGAGLAPDVDFISLASYGTGTSSSGNVEILRDVETGVAARNVLLVDDILESGRTLAFAKALFEERGARRVVSCVLLDKDASRAVPVEADFRGFACPNLFVVGYGMDLAHRYRELPFVGRIVQD